MRKRNLIGRMLSMALVSAMTFSLLTGCNGKEEEDSDVKEAFQFDSVSDVTFPLEEELQLDVFVNATTTGGGKYQNNYVTDWIYDKTNIKLNYVYDLDGDDAKTKLNLVMTDTENLPDIFLATGWTKAEVQSYGAQGLLQPMGDLLKDAENWNYLNSVSPSRESDLTMSDGEIYTYGNEDECLQVELQNRMWIYKPWVEKLNGGKMPQTTAELYDYLVKVRDSDPNGNGKADEIPISGRLGSWATDPTVWLINSFVQCNNPLSNTNASIGAGFTLLKDGTVEYAMEKDEYKDALTFIHKLYAEGLLDRQTFTQDENQYKASLDSEENLVALHAGGVKFADMAKFTAQQEGRWQDWAILEPVEGPDGVRLASRQMSNYFGMGVGIVSSSCKYPEIAVALFDFLASEEGNMVQRYGPEGFGWDWVEDGDPEKSIGGVVPTYKRYPLTEDFDWLGNGFDKEYKEKEWTYVSDACLPRKDQQFYAEEEVVDREFILDAYLWDAAEQYKKYMPDINLCIPNLAFSSEDAAEISEFTISIGGYVNQATVQFITGDLDVSTDWGQYISKLKDMGLDRYIELYQKTFDKYYDEFGKRDETFN